MEQTDHKSNNNNRFHEWNIYANRNSMKTSFEIDSHIVNCVHTLALIYLSMFLSLCVYLLYICIYLSMYLTMYLRNSIYLAMCLSIYHPPIYLCIIYLDICPANYSSAFLSIYINTYCIYLCTCLSMYIYTIYIYLSIYVYIHTGRYLSIYQNYIYLSTYLSIHISIYTPIYICTYLSIYLSIYAPIYITSYPYTICIRHHKLKWIWDFSLKLNILHVTVSGAVSQWLRSSTCIICICIYLSMYACVSLCGCRCICICISFAVVSFIKMLISCCLARRPPRALHVSSIVCTVIKKTHTYKHTYNTHTAHSHTVKQTH